MPFNSLAIVNSFLISSHLATYPYSTHNIGTISMAWRSSGHDNSSLIDNLKKNGLIQTESVEQAMRAVDRACYVPESPYEDSPQGIGFNATISAPHMHAMCLELLKDHLKPGNAALDIGSGSGYLVACMGIMVGPSGCVYGVEHIEALAEKSLANLRRGNPNLLSEGTVRIVCADGRRALEPQLLQKSLAAIQPPLIQPPTKPQVISISPHTPSLRTCPAAAAPPPPPLPHTTPPTPSSCSSASVSASPATLPKFQAIHVGAASSHVPPPLLDGLAPGGRLIIPVGPEYGDQYLIQIDKDAYTGNVTQKIITGVRYVPLCEKTYQLRL